MEGSKKFQLNQEDILKIAKGAGLAGAGAVVSYIIVAVADLDAGNYAWLIPLITIGLNAGRKWIANNSGE